MIITIPVIVTWQNGCSDTKTASVYCEKGGVQYGYATPVDMTPGNGNKIVNVRLENGVPCGSPGVRPKFTSNDSNHLIIDC